MKIVLATGIYPPDIGGPATYVQAIAREFVQRGIRVVVVTYTGVRCPTFAKATAGRQVSGVSDEGWKIVSVCRWGGPFLRWWRYARALREHAADADVVLAFSLVSVGVPLWLCRKMWPLGFARGKPKLMLRLGGDFLWERYTDCGGGLGLREWYASRFWFFVGLLARWLVGSLLRIFNYVVFSTRFQEEIYGEHYRCLPPHSVIENAVPETSNEKRVTRNEHTPFRLLFLGRFVAFKNLSALLRAMTELSGITLTLVGEGPLRHLLEGSVRGLRLHDRVVFRPKASSMERDAYFREHDLLVLPSVTEISPNTALEARAAGLPALLTEETGLSEQLLRGMTIRKLRTAEQIRDAIREVMRDYERVVREAAQPVVQRGWEVVGEEYLRLFNRVFHLPLVAPHPGPLPLGEGNLLMISGDRSLASGKRGAFWQTLEELRKHWERIDILCPWAKEMSGFRCPTSAEATAGRQVSGFDNVFVHPSHRGLWYQPLWILRMGKELSRQCHYTVMTVHDYPPFYNGLGAWLLHRAAGIPWIAEIHHVVGYPVAADFRECVGRRMYPLYLWTIGRSAAAFRVVNAGVREFLARWWVRRESIHLVPSFYLDHELLQPDPAMQKEYDIVFCGRFVVNKGVEELIESVDIVVKKLCRDRAVKALVIGDGPLRRKLEARSSKLEAQTTFAGWLPTPRDVYRAMQSAKVFVMCSKSEGGPRILLEAMALGLPVIATSVGIVPDIIRDGENGLITSGTPQDIAEKIQKLLSDNALRERLGQNAQKALQLFERKKLIREYAEFLQSFSYRTPLP